MNGKSILLLVLAISLVSTTVLSNSRVYALPGDKAIPLIHVYLYFPAGKPAQTKVTVAFGNDKFSNIVNTAAGKVEGVVMDDGTTHYGMEVSFKLPLKTRGLLPDVFSVCTTNLKTQEQKCNFPYVWWDKPTASDAWISVYNTH